MKDYTKIADHYLKRLYPITRSITGDGNRKTLRILKEIVPIEIKEYPSGQRVYDWTIPKEWNVRDAWIKNSRGMKIIDFKNSNLHLVGYSIPVHKQLDLKTIKKHLHYLESLPNAIPYRTSYYKEDWGFCLTYDDYHKYFDGSDSFEVFIDSDLKDGSLTVGEFLIPGKSDQEYLISTYICHPSLANDNLSGLILTTFLAKELIKKDLNHSYRIIWVPETIGAISYCANNEIAMKKIQAGFVITCIAGPGPYGYKESFDPKHPINKIIEQVFDENNIDLLKYPFDPHGSDERQYSSQGFRINMASITKDKYYEYAYYHTSLDDLDFVKAEYINESLNIYFKVIDKLDKNLVFANRIQNCEVMLGKYGLYSETGGGQLPNGDTLTELDMILWLLFCCDGVVSLFEIAERLKTDLGILYGVASMLEKEGILERIHV